jgi:hypothetical protein
MKVFYVRSLALFAAAAVIGACSDNSVTGPTSTPLAGLSKSLTNDTSNTTHNPSGDGPGFFHGTVIGHSPAGGPDTLTTAPRIAGVVVTIYTRKLNGDAVEPDVQKGTVTTGADGLFTLPTLPAGEYVVTFVPPEGSGLSGVYVFGSLQQTSGDYPWWITLPKK